MKRVFDFTVAGFGLVVLSPVLLALAVAIKVSDGGPVFFRQQRVGQGGKLFWILKFRSMVVNAEKLGISVTKDGDTRITRMGRFMRKTKLDELPQLWNVFLGEMSFVGPRPEVPRYVARYTDEQKQVLALKPGITDPASLEFRDEEGLLQKAGNPEAVEEFYMTQCVPRKIELSLEYAARAGVWSDVVVIWRTVLNREL